MNLNLDYLKESFSILIKRSFEYKFNLYSFSFVSIIYFLTGSAFVSAMYLNLQDLIGWSLDAFIFYVIYINAFKSFLSQFSSYKHLKDEVLSSRLNVLITKPKNIFLQHFFNSSNLFGLFDIFIYTILIIGFLFHNTTVFIFNRILITFLFSIFAAIFHIILFRALEATVFFIKNNSFILEFFVQPYRNFSNYPVVMFSSTIQTLAYLLPNVYFGAYATSFLFGYIGYFELFKLTIILLFLTTIFSLFLYLLWKFGIKYYEAFG